MSGFVGADVDQLDALASRLDRQGSAFREIVGSSTAALVVASWTGADIDRVRSEWTRVAKPAILRVADELSRIAGDLRVQAAEQREASRENSGRTAPRAGAIDGSGHRLPPVDPPVGGPTNMRGLIAGVKQLSGDDLFSISEIVGTDGVTRLIVTIPGTHGRLDNPDGWGQVGGWGSNPAIWLSQNSEVRVAIADALKTRLAAYPDAEVMLVGHSQGGMLAQSLADDPAFHIKEVVTVGSPTMTADHGFGGANVTRLEHNSDPVVIGTGLAAPLRNELSGHGLVADMLQQVMGLDGPVAGAATTFHGGSYFEGWGGDGNAHDVGVGDYDWLADQYEASNDAAISAARERQAPFLQGTVVGYEVVK
jgi:hypothetical protein